MSNVITLNMTPIDCCVKMAQGNPGAITVLMELLKKHEEKGIIAIMHLDDLAIRGWKIWVGYKDYCKRDIQKFFDYIMCRDADMIQFINNFGDG